MATKIVTHVPNETAAMVLTTMDVQTAAPVFEPKSVKFRFLSFYLLEIPDLPHPVGKGPVCLKDIPVQHMKKPIKEVSLLILQTCRCW